VRGSKAAEGGGALGALLSGLDAVPAKKPTKANGKTQKRERRRGGVPESEAVSAGTLKAALQQFALGAAGGYSGADAHVAFTTHLLECFGWPAGRPDGAAIPHTFAIADAGKRVEREVAVADGYGMPPDQGPTEFLLELNQLVAEDEQQGRKVRGPGLPAHFDPKDPRWFSTDCIEPPPVGS